MSQLALTCKGLIERIPQKPPFLFVDEIVSVDQNQIVGNYRYHTDEFFYSGHFPARPITPGVILLETMAQIGVVAFGLYLLSLERDLNAMGEAIFFFSDSQVEFLSPVLPGEKVTVAAEKIYLRMKKLRTKAVMKREDDSIVATATLSGVGVF